MFLLLSETPGLFTARLRVHADSTTFSSGLLEPFTPQREINKNVLNSESAQIMLERNVSAAPANSDSGLSLQTVFNASCHASLCDL